ncbi:MAG: gliding motility-associated ABC transporter ATP-binding subunit GldA [Bacteroidia bacterium]|nr:gliding motility-associated ABC transporter ATP-binding subunit GldA [Bacteroidia bacterium]
MSIIANNISKFYGKQKALNNVSFEVKSGEIVGFLGPNGAGKSTMMKILTCYIPQSSGAAKVCGFDVETESMQVRKNVGYLPEHNPLYLEMYIKEYLAFVAGLHEVKNINARVKEMIELTGLQLEQKKKIGALSKGYRQRVGLAQAMIHDPKVLIMDEPTTGLDPNQLEEIRSLIRQLGKQKTVLLSTHIMQEVEAVCDRAIIIDLGEMKADGKIADLMHQTEKQIVVVEFDKPMSKTSLKTIAGITDARQLDGNKWKLIAETSDDIRKLIFNFAVANNAMVLTLTREEQKMEDVFRDRTKS